MADGDQHEVTSLLEQWSGGDQRAFEKLMPLVYDELHRIARGYMGRERKDHTLQATALVNEAYMRLVDHTRMHWKGKLHFVALAAQTMRRILVDHARGHGAEKRGADAAKVSLDRIPDLPTDAPHEVVAIDEALAALAEEDPELEKIVEMRFFGGMTSEEIAALLGVSVPTVTRRWRLARAWLYRYLCGETADGD